MPEGGLERGGLAFKAVADRPSRRAATAILKLSESDPAFAALSLWCRHRDAEPVASDEDGDPTGEPPAWTNGLTVFYGPAFDRLERDEQMGVAAHHILHIAFRHAQRRRALALRRGERFQSDLYDLAADALVNETLIQAGRPPPRPCPTLTDLLDAAFKNAAAKDVAAMADLTADEALARFDVESLYVALADGDGAGGGRGRSSSDQSQRGGGGGDGLDDGRGDGRGDGSSDGRGDSGDNGAEGADGAAARARDYAARSGFASDLLDPEAGGGGSALGEGAEGSEAAEWRQRLARALEAGRAAGEGLGAIGHRLADLPQPAAPWETVLRGMVAKAALRGPRMSWARPTRRWVATEANARAAGRPEPGYEPGLVRREDTPRVVMGIDASASVSDTLLHRFAAEVCGVGRRTGAELRLLVFDVAVRAEALLKPGGWEREISKIDFTRGGGTSFVEVVDTAARADPSVIVILTDLDGPFGPAPGRIPVIWAVPSSRAWATPPFGTVLDITR
ncbi:MAG: VWA-like domain-containing protein [Pseudomonadota bacterium]